MLPAPKEQIEEREEEREETAQNGEAQVRMQCT